ncbi:cytochrome P450 6B6-like [Galleria mellonella]|uniref:unspecific monooxygenase n=1 Tax=Galleria mellonella TaxID=7137 RepID=A0A6J1WF11_GALME|nr:cytochrome P450 6B6-like [Galleria mellonella]
MITLAVILLSFIALYFYNKRTFNYWKKKNVKHDKPVAFFGNNKEGFFIQKSKVQLNTEMYNKYSNERVVGFYRGTKPELIIRDPELVKRILVTDFGSFFYRGFLPNKDVIEPTLRHLFASEGDLWKMLRTRMSPVFTSGKLKVMFPLIVEHAENLQSRISKIASSEKSSDAKELMARYATDFIGACGFGLEADSINNENSYFRKLGYKIFAPGLVDAIIAVSKDMFPELCKNLKFFSRIEDEAKQLAQDIQKARNYQPVGRNDYVDMMLALKNQGTIKIESIEKTKSDGSPELVSIQFDDDIFMAQLILFFAAGFETSSSSSSMTLHLLAYHPDKQIKVQEDIDRVLAKYNNKLCYDAVKDMAYLEMAFKESMRIFPPLGYISRQCTKDYTFTDMNLTINKGVNVMIPIQALHMDPKYWDKPEEYRPERFQSDNEHKDVYLPFGNGPRNCVGTRLGLMQAMAGLAAVLSKFTVEPAPNSKLRPVIDPKSEVVQGIVGGLPLIFRERNKTRI